MERPAAAQASTVELNETEIMNRFGKSLTKRQRDVLLQLLNGVSDRKTIGRNLGLVPGTIRDHLDSLYLLFGVHARTELIGYLVSANLVIIKPLIDEKETPIGVLASK